MLRHEVDRIQIAVITSRHRIREHCMIRQLMNATTMFAALALIAFAYRNSIFLDSVDTAHHLVLVEEIAWHHAVLPTSTERLGVMWAYPPGSHWIAALLVPLAGSGLVAMTWVAVISVFLCYAMLVWLSQRDLGIGAAAIFVLAIISAFPLRTLIGSEVIDNFFFPQLVAHVLALAFLCALVRVNFSDRLLAATTPLAGAVVMQVQPLVAIQMMGAALFFMLVNLVRTSHHNRTFHLSALIPVTISSALSVFAIITSPEFWFMRTVADNNGGLNLGFSHISFVIAPVVIIAGAMLWLFMSDRGRRTEGIVGSALAAMTILIILQDIAWLGFGVGSPYVVKKHLFLITTLGTVGLSRLLSRLLPYQPRFTGPIEIVAGAAFAAWITNSSLVPANTVLAPLRYAKEAAARLNAAPGSIASADAEIPPLANVMVSLLGFGHAHSGRIYTAYYAGNGGADLANRLMVRHSRKLDDSCPERQAPTAEFVVINSDCLRRYAIGTTLGFDTKGNASSYLSSSEWSSAEDWGRWAIGDKGSSVVLLIGNQPGDLMLETTATALARPDRPRLIRVKCNGSEIAVWQISKTFEVATYSAKIPGALSEAGRIEISFVPDEVIVPSELDRRPLGIGIKTLTLNGMRF
jgi:hypothetical protein